MIQPETRSSHNPAERHAEAVAGRADGHARPDGTPPLLDQIIECSPIGMAVIDFEGIYRTVNPAYCAIYGYRREEMLGRSFTMVFPPPNRAPVLALHQAFLNSDGDLNGDWEVVRSDGTALAILSESVRYPGEDGHTRRLVYVVDITERKRMELALQASQGFVQSVLDALSSHICVLDESGLIVAVNRAWREFASANDGQTDRVAEGVNYLGACMPGANEHDVHAFRRQLVEILAGRLDQFQHEYACHSPTEQRWFLARVSRILGSEPARFVVAHDNVTSLKETQETLRQGEALLLDLAASIPGAMFRLAGGTAGDWRFVYVSPGLESLFEVTPAQACADVNAVWDCIAAEDRAAHDASACAALASGEPWEYEYRIRTRSGQLKWVHAQAQPKPGYDGAPVWTGVFTDVSQRKQIEAALMASEQTYRTLFETVPQGVVYHDDTGRVTSANPAALRILGLTRDQLRGISSIDPRWRAIREDGSDFPAHEFPIMVALRTGEPVKDVVMGVSVPDRGYVWILLNANPLLKDGRVHEVYATFEDITERVLLSQELRRQAGTDDLTGVANRRRLMARLNREFERVVRHPQQHCGVLALDLDHFKQVNDTWGHAAGDEVLRQVTRLMHEETRLNDLVGRTGGEEFTLLLPDTDFDEALALAERLRCRVAQCVVVHGSHAITITVSIGVGIVTAADASAETALARADRALYEAKSSGRNTVRLSR